MSVTALVEKNVRDRIGDVDLGGVTINAAQTAQIVVKYGWTLGKNLFFHRNGGAEWEEVATDIWDELSPEFTAANNRDRENHPFLQIEHDIPEELLDVPIRYVLVFGAIIEAAQILALLDRTHHCGFVVELENNRCVLFELGTKPGTQRTAIYIKEGGAVPSDLLDEHAAGKLGGRKCNWWGATQIPVNKTLRDPIQRVVYGWMDRDYDPVHGSCRDFVDDCLEALGLEPRCFLFGPEKDWRKRLGRPPLEQK